MQELPSFGDDPCHIALDKVRKVIYVANYTSGSFTVFALEENGKIKPEPIYKEKFETGSGVNPERQESSHLHQVCLFKDSVFVVDLGSDRILHYKVQTGPKIVKDEKFFIENGAGTGPRHMAVHPEGEFAYVLNELISSISVYEIKSGTLNKIDEIEIKLPEKKDPKTTEYGSEIEIHPNGNWLYISNRGTAFIGVFKIDSGSGNLAHIQTVELSGTWPRHFAIKENRFVVADQFENKLTKFEICQESGKLINAEDLACGENNPAMITFL